MDTGIGGPSGQEEEDGDRRGLQGEMDKCDKGHLSESMEASNSRRFPKYMHA